MDEENPTSPDIEDSGIAEQQPVLPEQEEPQQPTESEDSDGLVEAPEQIPGTEPPANVEVLPEYESITRPGSSVEDYVVEDPQLYATNFVTDDYVITLVHEFTLGDVLIATLLSVLIVVVVLKAVLGGGRSW